MKINANRLRSRKSLKCRDAGIWGGGGGGSIAPVPASANHTIPFSLLILIKAYARQGLGTALLMPQTG